MVNGPTAAIAVSYCKLWASGDLRVELNKATKDFVAARL